MVATSPVRAVVTSRKRCCEDAWGALQHDGVTRAVWVVDGATPLEAGDPAEGNAQVAHFAWALSRGLQRTLGLLPTTVVVSALSRAVEAARAEAFESFRVRFPRAGSCPTATLSLALRTGQDLIAWCLGDSPLWIDTGAGSAHGVLVTQPDGDRDDTGPRDGITAVVDPQYVGNEQRALSLWRGLLAQGCTVDQAYGRVLQRQAAARPLRNTPEGSWILGDSDRAVHHATVRRVEVPEPTRVCVLSDGMERAVAPFGLCTRWELFEALHEGRGAGIVQALRAAEDADPTKFRVPRLTAHDDVTAVAAVL